MSLCNTFRLCVACCIVMLSCIDAPVAAFTLRRTTFTVDSDSDLAQDESVLLEVNRELHVPYKENKTEETTTTINLEQDIVTERDSSDQTTNIPNETLMPEETTTYETEITTESSVTNAEWQTVNTSFILEDKFPISTDFDNRTETDTTTNFIDFSTTTEININESETTEFGASTPSDSKRSNTEDFYYNTIKMKQEFKKINLKDKQRPTPKWKKYKTIERKRPTYLSEEKVKEREQDSSNEDILKAETKHIRVTLQDTVTSDIPSLESLKNDLISSNINFQTSESKNGVTQSFFDEELTSTPFDFTTSISSTQVGHESKRAGFLNFSGKTMTSAVITETTTSEVATEYPSIVRTSEGQKSDSKTISSKPYIIESESPVTDVLQDKIKIESQIVMNDDAIKDELLKEALINDNEENAKRQREDLVDNNAYLTEIRNINPEYSAETNSSSGLSVKSINNEKSKNTTLYTVNPNYKPMKKIEVVPPKQFVRDPDDNSWRNESLSSLGIVFKPKNSSKPFTQVLKNKTETEWNNFSDKDIIKNDIPDLRERLQKMGEKRKSKRKKMDSFGNVVYFDYEEISNSAEHAAVTINELSSTVTTYSPALQSTNQSDSLSTEGPQNVTETITSTITLTNEGLNQNAYTTKIPTKLFNEYYDSTDEDDTDYLNMAKIDLKKFSTSFRPSTPFHPSTIVAREPEWLKQTANKLMHNVFPERKATIQYFPPLKTQKVNINEYDNGFKFKMESFTTAADVPHNVPVSIEGPTTPVTVTTVGKSDFTKNLMLTPPQVTTDPALALNNDGSFDRGTYVIKHYKDFVNEAAKDSEYDKNFGYAPYTESPVEGLTKTDLLSYEKEPPRTIDSGYDYDNTFRKDVLQRFVDNFNQNRERYRSDFPILFNSSIIHRGLPNGEDVASSRAFMRGAYNSNIFKPKFAPPNKACEPNCDKITVELSPAYELHYYVPEQEENEEAQPVTLPYQYRL